MTTSKLQAYLNNNHSQLKLEKISSLGKDTKIKELEDLVIKLGLDTKDIKVAEEIIKIKNVDSQALRKQLQFPTTEHPQAQEVSQLEKEKEKMLQMVIRQNILIQKMEA